MCKTTTMRLCTVASLVLAYFGVVMGCLFESLEPPVGETGSLSSLNYPELYPPGTCQLWSIRGRPGDTVVISIVYLNLPTWTHGLCDNDYLLIGPLERRSYCGDSSTTTFAQYEAVLTSSVTSVFVLFNSTHSGHSGRGFLLKFKLINSESPHVSTQTMASNGTNSSQVWTTPAPRSNSQDWIYPNAVFTACQFNITGSTSGAFSNNSLFKPLLKYGFCIWRFHPSAVSGAQIDTTLTFYACKLHKRDKLYVYVGPKGSLLGSYDWQTCPKMLSPVGSQILLVYKPNLNDLRVLGVPKFDILFSAQYFCRSGYRSCGVHDQACYRSDTVCDGVKDCPISGFDEEGCEKPNVCPSGQLSCNTTMKACYRESDRCNGKGECKNYMDETNCTIEQCSPSKGLFLCQNGRCIFEKWRCDHTRDCADNSDEEGCSPGPSPRVIVAAVVGALTCSLVLVIALGCVCKLYTLRMQQLHGTSGPHRPDTPLTRLQAELFRRRAPPPPYNEAMLTSRPYDQAYQETLHQTGLSSCQGDPNLPPSQQSGSRPHHTCRRNRRHRRHRDIPQIGSFLGVPGTEDTLVLLSAESVGCSNTAVQQEIDNGTEEPPPYLPREEERRGADSSSSDSEGDDDQGVVDDDDDDVPLLYLGSLTSADIEMSAVARECSATPAVVSTQSSTHANTQNEGTDTGEKDVETASTSLSLDSDPIQRTAEGEEEEEKEEDDERIMPIIEEDSDSDCILAADEDGEEDDDIDDIRDVESDSDTALLLADV